MSQVAGQVEHDRYRKAADLFFAHYNADNYDGIFNMFSADMQQALPMNKTVLAISQLKEQLGNYKERKLTGYESTYASYLGTFEKGKMQVLISLDNTQQVNGLFFKPAEEGPEPATTRNTTPMQLPFKGEWYVFWGGDTPEQNYHVATPSQRGAFDFLVMDDSGSSFKGDGRENEDYYAFGKDVIAPCSGEVVLAVDGVKDNIPGKMNPVFVTGNTVIIKASDEEYVLLAHFKQGTVAVEQGEQVEMGQYLGQCGNSGNSSEAHIHFHIQNAEEMTEATGVKCYFNKILVDGEVKEDYSPVKGASIQNAQ